MPLEKFGPLGAVIQEDYTLEADEAIAKATGESVFFGDSPRTAQFAGRWEYLKSRGVTGIFLWERYEKFRPLVPWKQEDGVCVAVGTHQAVQHSYYNALAASVQIGEPVEIAYEPIYAGSRVYVGKGQLTGAGSVGAWAAQWVAGVNGIGGTCRRGRYGTADLTLNNERWAVANADRNDRFPPELLAELQRHTCSAHRVRNNAEIADALASRFGVARCWNTLFGNRNSDGFSAPSGQGAHCQAVIGVFVRKDGGTGFIELQSWGPNMPGGPRTLKYAGGELTLPPGCYAVTSENFARAQQAKWWEAWAFSVREGQEFR
jgi:hypothetical protein